MAKPSARQGMTGKWNEVSDMLSRARDIEVWKRAKRRAVLKEAHRIRGIMIEAFNAGGPPGKRWKSLSTFTQLVNRFKRKGDRRPLMDTGDLRNSHNVHEEDEDTVFVGVHRTARGRKSKKQMVNLAFIHEYGAGPIYIRVTPKMRFWWNHVLVPGTKWQIKPLRQSTIAIIVKIPPRPWVGPIWDSEQGNSPSNIINDTLLGLGIPMFAGMVPVK